MRDDGDLLSAKPWLAREQQQDLRQALRDVRGPWLVTGAAGFIGSHLVETLLLAGQQVIGLDNFATGRRANLQDVRSRVGDARWRGFRLIEGDIRSRETCAVAASGAGIVLHQAALGSVPRSIEDPATTHDVNVTGFLNVLDAARIAGVGRFVYASSSSVYGDSPDLPKREDRVGRPLSPYAASKAANELYAGAFARSYSLTAIGLRYFNVFGPRQDPDGAYAAVIPRWAASMIADRPVQIFGDGSTSRDFCYVDNVVQANLRAALMPGNPAAAYNVAVGGRMTLRELFESIRGALISIGIRYGRDPVMTDFRDGDIRHSQAAIDLAAVQIGYVPTADIAQGLAIAIPWYARYQAEAQGDLATGMTGTS